MSARRLAVFLQRQLPATHDASASSCFTHNAPVGKLLSHKSSIATNIHTSSSMFSRISHSASVINSQPFCKLHTPSSIRKTKRVALLSQVPNRTFHRSSAQRKSEVDPRIMLPQLEVPDYETDLKFKGLETDFPCLSRSPHAGAEPEYHKVVSGYKTFHYDMPFSFKYNDCVLPELDLAYETWGELNDDRSNAILVFTGLSASSHCTSHEENTDPGWWEKFVGPGCAIDTDKFFVVCCNHIGSCYGTTGPSSINPLTGKPYGTTFPLTSIEDMVKVQFLLLDFLGIERLHAAVGASLGGMCSLQAAALFPDRIGRVISISSCVQTQSTSIALRFLQRQAIMKDPNWQRGHYYGTSYPRMGMKIAREIATITYRSGPEWKERFGRRRIDPNEPLSLCPTFEIESYIMHQGETFCHKFDPNSLLYITKAMDLFDMAEGFDSMEESLSRVSCPVMVLGAQSDILIPVWQQKEMADTLRASGNENVAFYELNSFFGHDTFLLDLSCVGGAVKGHLETNLNAGGLIRKPPPSWLQK